MLDLELSTTLLSFLLPFLFLFIIKWSSIFTTLFPSKSPLNSTSDKTPASYPIVGSLFSIYANRKRNRLDWMSEILSSSPTSTFVLHRPLGRTQIFTANPSNVEHILKSHFHTYPKSAFFRMTQADLLGDGIFNTDGESWKFQRQVASHEFNTKSLRKFVEQVVDTELNDRLVPILSAAANSNTVLDLQDIFQRFAFDNVCAIAFGYDPASLVPSLPQVEFMKSFEDAVRISSQRFQSIHPLLWKAKRCLDVGSEKNLRIAVEGVREFAKELVKEKKHLLNEKSELDSFDLLSRFLSSGHSDENFVTDIVISFILAGRDTTSAALIWFFWLVSKNPNAEGEILREIYEKSESPIFEEVKDMVYTHASLSESMRLYPPVPVDGKQAIADDVLPDGTFVKKGTPVAYHPYAMGRSEKIWGKDWAEFKPERWLERDDAAVADQRKWNFVGRDPYTYPVFQAGPRVCLGREMAFLQMKRVVAGVFRRFRVVPAFEDGKEPVFVSYLTSKMEGGFPVRIEERA
ncbi:cytochrome P450 94A2-like [Rhododendron vialii]|uniref:cytochrome P450 94A2-like n=1 Tax=Rhododendron vialii TaxID=182163 RepID=UPI00265EDB42|nr:cytochrome P450 94A2-like [Rhododendron vialii]